MSFNLRHQILIFKNVNLSFLNLLWVYQHTIHPVDIIGYDLDIFDASIFFQHHCNGNYCNIDCNYNIFLLKYHMLAHGYCSHCW